MALAWHAGDESWQRLRFKGCFKERKFAQGVFFLESAFDGRKGREGGKPRENPSEIVACNAGLGAAERGARAAWDQAVPCRAQSWELRAMQRAVLGC